MFQQRFTGYQMPTQSPDAKFKQGLAYHQAGRLDLARPMYEDVLRAKPDHPDALHFLGVIEISAGDFARAVVLIEKSISINATNPSAFLNLGNALRASAQLDKALASYGKAIELMPNYAPAHIGRSAVLEDLGDLDAALASIDTAIGVNPGNPVAHYNRANVLRAQGLYDAAVASYDGAIAIDANFADAHFNRAAALVALQKREEALAGLDQAIAIRPGYEDAYFSRGNLRQELARWREAIQDYDLLIQLKPDFADGFFQRGNALRNLHQFDDAIHNYDQAIALKPDHADAYCNRGGVLREQRQFGAALQSYDRAIALKPDYAEAYSNRGVALKDLQRLEAAVASYERAIELKPDYAEAYSNRGNALKDLKQLPAAIQSYDQAIAIGPGNAATHANKALVVLLGGDFANGWPLFEWRWKDEKNGLAQRHFSQPLWLGEESLDGKSILLHTEQGLGDTIQFCRYAKLLAAQGARVLFEVERPLLSLLRNLEGVSELFEQGTPLPQFDFHCPLLSLPLAFKTELGTVPSSAQYLFSDSAKRARWLGVLGTKTKPRVGLVWSGSTTHKNDANRSIDLIRLIEKLPDGCEYFSLQKEVRSNDLAVLSANARIRHFGDLLQDFSETAALCAEMDVIISVDTSVAHLGAALGKPTWVLLPYVPDWRWLLDRFDSPWYPSARLYRQGSPFQWDTALQGIHADLLKLRTT